MNAFAKAVKNTIAPSLTENGALTLSRSGNNVVDLFYFIGSGSKQSNFDHIIVQKFEKAFAENPELATRVLLWSRDIRGGAGRRKVFRDILLHMEKFHKDILMEILPYVWNYGRWDDYLIFTTAEIREFAFDIIRDGLSQKEKAPLVAKWMDRKGKNAVDLRNYLKLTPKKYRKMLVGLTQVVETQMCAKKWEEINFSHVPSVASARYSKAFTKHAPVSYANYLSSLKKGETKVNASAIFPHDVVKAIRNGNVDLAREQWKALPDFMGDVSAIPMIDVSGSMETMVDKTTRAIDIALSLGLYCADKNTGPFKDVTLVFSNIANIDVLKGDIVQKLNQLNRQAWGGSTNVQAGFDNILKLAKDNNLKPEDMPKYLLIISDMQFDPVSNRGCVTGYNQTNFEAMSKQYAKSGYVLPKIIFWNVVSHTNDVPVKHSERNVALVSGYSPTILKNIFKTENFTPVNVMLETIMNPRYNIWENS